MKTPAPHVRPCERGFTLIELMVAVTVLGVLLALAVPTFRDTIRSNQLVAQNNEFVGALNFARSEAVKRGGSVTICSSTDGSSCANSTDWSTGFIAFVDLNSNGDVDGAAETLLQAYPATANQFLLSSAANNFVRYQSTGMSSAAETFSLHRSGCTGPRARQITVSLTGRITTTKVDCP